MLALCCPVIFFAWPGGRIFFVNAQDAMDRVKKTNAAAERIFCLFFITASIGFIIPLVAEKDATLA